MIELLSILTIVPILWGVWYLNRKYQLMVFDDHWDEFWATIILSVMLVVGVLSVVIIAKFYEYVL